ncbi:threonine synthase [Ponticaulis sp.]|uniref:threonine synthase n=1 Tax=Ponticaulis sp. TaxID=2020902 RepID=UPI000B715B4B|nr:threonine synthase [Ponticaulis sp.]MAI90839.1 threonine synthase [Ponticaulis sp.]OUX98814.1 MAG: threonine synthase [Hyphomonadaceae bacterium TMED5]|tara:strand:- start:173 stop:1552 length:1380 start_codon:yes stop_codon:yes gene_type:complete
MEYVSTRGESSSVSFADACLAGLAPDGGLYTPVTYPKIQPAQPGESYLSLATRILSAFAGDSIPTQIMSELVEKAYASFAHQSVTPLNQIGPDRWMLELHHGPTLAFKDVAMQIIAQIYDHLLTERGERLTVLCATSGDTGGAAAAAFAGLKSVDVFILHPHERISPIQRRFMTSTGAENIHNFALDSDFDECQAIVKSLFADHSFRDEVSLSGVNSINWTRIAAQSVYFAAAQGALGADRNLRFVVPTGNFGDALAAYVAARCGMLNGLELVSAVNSNTTMVDLMNTGALTRRSAVATHSPAMDIALPSNAERLLFEVMGKDGAKLKAFYDSFAQSGTAELDEQTKGALGCVGVKAVTIDDEATEAEMKRLLSETGTLQCPHTAVGSAAAREIPTECVDVILSTAHAAKFPETVSEITGKTPPLPDRSEEFLAREEVYERLPADLHKVREAIRAGVRR